MPIQIRKCRFERKLAMKMGKRPLIPRSYRSRIMPYRHVVSYTFSRSKDTATACCFLMKALRRKVSNLTRWSRVDRPRLKPHWYSEMRRPVSSVQTRRSLTILSMVLQMHFGNGYYCGFLPGGRDLTGLPDLVKGMEENSE